jgi:hypothetical protein
MELNPVTGGSDSIMLPRVLVLVLVVTTPALAAAARDGWVPYINDRFGFSFRYPADVFEPERKSERGDGELFVGVGGEASLLVGAFENSDGHTVASYMSFIRRDSYSKYPVAYAPKGQIWFVLSGETSQNVFYEKVMFSCGGRIINSFALTYPVAAKRVFDPVVEGIENSFRPGQSCNSHADR